MKLINDIQLTENFMLSEFACRDPNKSVYVDFKLLTNLQKLRDFLGVPIYINSGYRTDAYNKQIGGAPTSQHTFGKAVDIKKIPGVSDKQFVLIASLCGFGGIGVYETYYHIDVRSERARWWDES